MHWKHFFALIQSTFKSLEMHSKRCYKSCICSVVLGQLESFRNHLGPQYYFPENFRCNFRFYESENFSDSSLHRIFESENFRYPFSSKKAQSVHIHRKGEGSLLLSEFECPRTILIKQQQQQQRQHIFFIKKTEIKNYLPTWYPRPSPWNPRPSTLDKKIDSLAGGSCLQESNHRGFLS